MTTATDPTITIDPEALAYAEQVGLRAAFDHMLAATPRLVPNLRWIHVKLKPDFDVPGKMNIIWDMRMEATTKEVYLKANRDWGTEFIRVTPQWPREHVFSLRLFHGDV